MNRLVLVISVMLIAAACSSGSEPAGPSPDGAMTPATAPEGGEVDTTLAHAESSSGDDSGGPSCVGVWELDNEAFFAEYAGFADPGEAIKFVSGAYFVMWNADGTFTDERADWTMAFPEMPESGMMVMNSLGAGSWEADGSSFVSAGYALADARIQIIVDGDAVELPVDPGALPAGVFPDRGSVSCTATTMTVSAGGFESILHRQG